nr:uncharacterized protein LOC103349848 [Oryctolagus cuniculus]
MHILIRWPAFFVPNKLQDDTNAAHFEYRVLIHLHLTLQVLRKAIVFTRKIALDGSCPPWSHSGAERLPGRALIFQPLGGSASTAQGAPDVPTTATGARFRNQARVSHPATAALPCQFQCVYYWRFSLPFNLPGGGVALLAALGLSIECSECGKSFLGLLSRECKPFPSLDPGCGPPGGAPSLSVGLQNPALGRKLSSHLGAMTSCRALLRVHCEPQRKNHVAGRRSTPSGLSSGCSSKNGKLGRIKMGLQTDAQR